MPKKKLIAILSGAIVLLGGGVAVRQKTVASKEVAAVQTAPVVHQNFIKTISSSGKTKATRQVDLKFQTSGRLTWVGVKEGDHVAAYQAIAALDPREVQKTLTKTLRDYSDTRNTFDETKLVTYNGHSPADSLNDTMRRILEQNQWDLDKAVLDVELKSLGVEYATLVTPIAGIVTSIDTSVAGINITPATAVFTVVDPASIAFEANADETDIGGLTLGQQAQITLDAFPNATFSGKISYISYASELSAGGATVFPVRISFDAPNDIKIGLNGDVTIDSINIPDALMVPIEAIREDTSGKYVYKKVGSTYEKSPVHTGEQNDTRVVVTTGLTEGEMVATRGFTNIKSK